ncbi:MAG: hypothetical protein EOP12_03675 [Pseudomonas sp.]|nr:MAG: hypothetical protein EOP12_03675 [Pseudomonas sp.]
MNHPSEDGVHDHRVIVIASSVEGIDALARLVYQLPPTFPLPVVVQVHGLRRQSIDRLTRSRWQLDSRVKVVYAQDGDHLDAGCVYVIPAENGLVFTNQSVLGYGTDAAKSSVDDLFESAALWHGSGVIGVVLSGLGTDGTKGLLAITNAQGVRIVQSPIEAAFPGMPVSALCGDHVQYSVMLDQLVALLVALVAQADLSEPMSIEVQAELTRLLSTSKEDRQRSLDRSIVDILAVMRKELVIDIVFVSKEAGDAVIAAYRAFNPGELGIADSSRSSRPSSRSLCQLVLDDRLATLMPDAAALRSVRDVPGTSVAAGVCMSAHVWLRGGTLYGTLCCLDLAGSPELGQRRYERLQMSARQIARLVNESGEK